MFIIAESDTYKGNLKKPELLKYTRKITQQVYPVLKSNPFYGPNIKKLRGDLSDIYRYRIGKFRLFYIILETEKRVVLLSLRDRKDAY